jgi:predicted ABC-type ATPase
VDVTQAFIDRLTAEGISVEDKSVAASSLKATQNQLNGGKVGAMMTAMRDGNLTDAPIFVTRDGYVVDGHHRWAAKVGVDAGDGELGDVQQPVRMIDMEIGEALDFANAFTAEIGIKQTGFGQAAKATVRPDTAGYARLGTQVDDLVESLSNVTMDGGGVDVDGLPVRLSQAAADYDAAMRGNDPVARAKAFLALSKALTDVNNALDNGGTEPERQDALAHLASAVAINDANVSRLFPPAGKGGTDPGLEGKVLPPGAVKDFLGNAGNEKIVGGGSGAAHLIKGEDGQYRLTVERQALHDAVLADILDGVPASDDPTYNFFGGGPASGKGGITKMYPQLEEGAAYINPDDIKFALPEMQPRVRAGDDTASSFVHEESSYLAKVVQAEGFNRGVNVTLDGTGDSSADAVRKKLAQARKAGYKVDAYYVSVPVDIAVERAEWRAKNGTGSDRGRAVPRSVIEHAHIAVSQILPEVAEEFDSLVVFDTNVPRGTSPNLMARKDREQRLEVMMEGKWQEFLDKARYGSTGD